MDVDTRLLRYFAAVAAEGSLSRAAERLFVSQPAQTKQLEGQLGVQLFTRSRAGMTLTAAGQALAGRTPGMLAGWDQVLRETRAAASRAARVLRVGFMSSAANEATQQIIAAFGRRRAGWRVDLEQAAWSDPTAGLAGGEVDVALLRLPFPGQDDMRIEVLLTEPRWVALPVTHPLAAADQICFRQLWDEPFVAAPAQTGLWRDYHLATAERQGHPVRIGAVTDQPDAYLTAIANGDGVARALGGAGREGRLRRRDLGALVAAGARRPALPGTRGVRPGTGVAAGAGHPVPAGAAPGAPGLHVHAGRRPAPPGHLPGRADRVRAAGGGPEHRLPHIGECRAGGGGHSRAGRPVPRVPVLRVPGGRRPADHRGGPGRARGGRAAGQPRAGDRAARRGAGDRRGGDRRGDRAGVRGPGPGRGQRDRHMGRTCRGTRRRFRR